MAQLYIDIAMPNSYYNTCMLSLGCIQPLAPEEHEALGRIFVRHGVHRFLGVALVHRHFLLQMNHVMLRSAWTCRTVHPAAVGGSLGQPDVYSAAWTLVPNRMNGVDECNFTPYEMARVTAADSGSGGQRIESWPAGFVQELHDHMRAERLEGRVGVAVLDPSRRRLLERPNRPARAHDYIQLPQHLYRSRVEGSNIIPAVTCVCRYYTEWPY
jgi:hypothetical protein